MASPHAAGVAALILSANPTWSPAQVRDEMVADATPGVVSNAGTGSPNLLLFVDNGGAPPPPPGTTVFFDNFETGLGWTTNPNGTDTATTGQWVRGDPAGTSSGITLQLGTTVSGVNDLVTGAAAGTGAGSFDVDGGVTSILSPAIALPASGTLNADVLVVPRPPQQLAERGLLPRLGGDRHHDGRVPAARCGHQPCRRLGDGHSEYVRASPGRRSGSASRRPTPRPPASSRPASTTYGSHEPSPRHVVGRVVIHLRHERA